MSSVVVSEIFGPTIQGEGPHIGRPTVFVRTGGCDFNCSWCDSLHAVDTTYRDEWTRMSSESIMASIRQHSGGQPLLVTLSGGNPALQPLEALIALGKVEGYSFALETQGSLAQPWFSSLDVLTLSPKPPSAGMAFSADKLAQCISAAGDDTEVVLKIVIQDETDLMWAAEQRQAYPNVPLTLQPCNTQLEGIDVDMPTLNEKMRWLIQRVTSLQWFNVRVLPQLHVQLWGNERGV